MLTLHHQNRNTICLPFLPSSSFSLIRKEEESIDIDSWTGEGHYLSLIFKSMGPASESFIAALAEETIKATRRRNKPGKPFKKALAALTANLLRIEAKITPSYGYHGMSPEAFRLLPVGYKPFSALVKGMEALGYIHMQKGYREHTGKKAKREATKFKATPKLLALATDYGITPAEWRAHFQRLPRPKAIPNPIVLKSKSTWTGKGKRMPIDRKDPVVMALAKPIDELNEFFFRQVIEPDCHYAFQRIFANGNDPDIDWDSGARIYSTGDSYQHMPQEERATITINGEPTIELDIKASHVLILHSMAKAPLPNRPDPYDIPDFDRGAVKAFVAMTLGYDKFHKDWTEEAAKNYAKKRAKKSLPPLDLPPFAKIKDATLRAIPLLNRWPDSPFRWGDLQYIESEVIQDTVHTLAMVHNVPALPVHDSIIVPVSKRALAEAVLSAAFEKHVGLTPIIEAKSEVRMTV